MFTVRNKYACIHAGNNMIRPFMLNDDHKDRYPYTPNKLMSKLMSISCFYFSFVTDKNIKNMYYRQQYDQIFIQQQSRQVCTYEKNRIYVGIILKKGFLANSNTTGDDLL